VLLVGVERDGPRDFHRHGPDLGEQPELVEREHDLAVELGDRAGLQRHDAPVAACRGDDQLMVDEIELDLKTLVGVWDQPGGQTTCRHVQHNIPPVAHQRGVRQSDLAHDLGHQLQRVSAVGPLGHRQFGPHCGGIRHCAWCLPRTPD
jgi:hypothetical protein